MNNPLQVEFVAFFFFGGKMLSLSMIIHKPSAAHHLFFIAARHRIIFYSSSQNTVLAARLAIPAPDPRRTRPVPSPHQSRTRHSQLWGFNMGLSSKQSKRARERDSYLEDLSDLGEEEEAYDDEEVEDREVDGSDEEDVTGNESDEGGKDDEMEELEKEYMDLRNQEQDILRNLKRHKDEDVLKGQAVKNQKIFNCYVLLSNHSLTSLLFLFKALWDKTLEFRFLLQKAFSSSNRLAQEPVRSSFSVSDEGVGKAYSDLITSSKKTLDSLLELQEALLEKNPSIAQALDGNSGQSSMKHSKDSKNLDVEGDDEWLQVSQMHKRIASFRDKSIDKWQRKTQVTTGAAAIKGKLHAFNQNISEQVAAFMRDPSRMIKQMQQRRSTVGVFEAVHGGADNTKGEEAHADGDPELLDDSEFYQQLLKEFFETIDPTSSETAFYAIKKLQTKKRKIVDRRASKSRKIRYNVHEKIVNFMAPLPMDLPPMAPKLFENLFGSKTRKPATVS
ncbi:hypothetical protein JRO89_XS12G0247200 [Xanthoceras sorbifolium]|uniref:Protein AATF n=1 Tax=Xanthoceras sorbifolium TaxID=99658 RepID=A0ABQ8HDN8_9ROSI|nr:hypothetical protein JRO89_XS12G0247200 [Xanthoceras sorbifolium]